MKEFFKPTKTKIILFIIIAVLGFLSNALKINCFGPCPDNTIYTVINTIPRITSPGINALLRDDGFFMNYKPSETAGMVFEGIIHVVLDIIYWYILSCLILAVYHKLRK